jgi:hypothetical protein
MQFFPSLVANSRKKVNLFTSLLVLGKLTVYVYIHTDSPSIESRNSAVLNNNIIIVRLIKTCLKENCSKIRKVEYFSDAFPIQNCLKQEDAMSKCLITTKEIKIVLTKELRGDLNSRNPCYHSIPNVLASTQLTKTKKIVYTIVYLLYLWVWKLVCRIREEKRLRHWKQNAWYNVWTWQRWRDRKLQKTA